MAGIATATAVVFVATTQAGTQGGGNPPWFPSLMAFEHYDSGRTKLFKQAHFTGSFARDNAVDAHISLDGMSVNEISALANTLLGGGSNGYAIDDLSVLS
jgi:hypothetical protein